MIQVIGAKRVVLLIILLAANIALGATTYLYLIPENETLTQQLGWTRNQIREKRAEAERLRTEYAQVQERKAAFENLQAAGFISDQNRLVARRRITDIQQYAEVLRAGYNISSASVLNRKALEDIGYVVLSSPIEVNIEALDDIDVYKFIYWMESAFPGHTAVTELELQRVRELNAITLREIGSGSPITLLKGKMKVLWRTIMPDENVKETGEFGTQDF